MKVIGLIKNPKWKKFLKHDELDINCNHCKFQEAEDSIPFQEAEDSIPKENFVYKKIKDNKSKSIISVTVKEISIVTGSQDEVIGWNYQA